MSDQDSIIIQDDFSTDLHLFIQGQPNATGALVVGQRTRVRIGLSGNSSVAAKIAAIKSSVTYDTTQNTRATTQSFITFDVQADSNPMFMWLIFAVAPGALAGQVYCRVSNGVAVGAAGYSNIIFRVTVHDSLTRFWLGNKAITLFNDTQSDAKEVTVYGECADGNSLTSVVNLSRQEYVRLEYKPTPAKAPAKTAPVTDIAITGGMIAAQLSSFTPSTAARGTIAVTIGTATPSPRPGTTAIPEVPIYVVAGTTTSRPLLRRFYTGGVADSDRKLKILFLFEGFTNKAAAAPWLEFIKDQFTANAIHSPFDILKDSVDLWTADWFSRDASPGITLDSLLTQAGYLIPSHPVLFEQVGAGPLIAVDGRPGGYYSLNQLLKFVGLPSVQDPTTLVGMQANWTGKNLQYKGQAFDIGKVDPVLYEAWRRQVPKVATYVKDTLLGVTKGTFNLETSSPNELTRADWGVESVPAFPKGDNRSSLSRFYGRFLDILGSLTTPATAKGNKMVGSDWAIRSTNKKAAGLVCIVVNDPTQGGVSTSYGEGIVRYLNTTFSTGARKFYTLAGPDAVTDITFPDPAPVTTPATGTITAAAAAAANAQANLAATTGIATFIHELGHLLGMGDEYGNAYGKHLTGKASLTVADVDVDKYPNIVTAQSLVADNVATLADQTITPPGTGAASYMSVQGKVKDPATINWNWDRTELSSYILTTPQVVAGAATPTVRIRVEAGQDWLSKKDTTVLLRKGVLSPGAIDTTLLYPMLLKQVLPVAATNPKAPATPTAAYIQLDLEGTLPAATSALAIKKGDVIYVPRYYPVPSTTTPGTGTTTPGTGTTTPGTGTTTPGAGTTTPGTGTTTPGTPTAPIKMRLIAEQVAQLMKTSTFKVTDDQKNCNDLTEATSQQSPTPAFVAAMTTDLTNRGITTGVAASYRIIAIYEGGGEYNCAAYRSSGFSKMRAGNIEDRSGNLVSANDVLPFSYVCQYYLVNKINPPKLAELDSLYDSRAY
jgi:hypothetical protein